MECTLFEKYGKTEKEKVKREEEKNNNLVHVFGPFVPNPYIWIISLDY